MSNDFILQIITAILCFVSILFAIFLLFVASKNKLGNRILALFLIVRAIDASVIIYINYVTLHPALDVFRHDAGGFLQLPLLFLFVLSIIYRDFKLKRKYLLLLIPFLLSTLVAIPRYYLEYLGFGNTLFNGLPLSFEISFTYTLIFIQNLSLIVLTFVILKLYKRIMLQNFSKTDNDNHRWLFRMNVISSFLFLAALIKNIHKYQENPQFIMQLRILVMTISLLFICWLVFKALMAPKLFRGINSSLQLVNVNDGPKLFEETNEGRLTLQKIEKLKAYMDHKEPYLNPELTIAGLAAELDINVTELSTMINHHLSQNFHLFVNQYRIHKAKELLSDASNNYNIQEILYKVGFNSKSSFNVSFKRLTGVTPSQYKNKVL